MSWCFEYGEHHRTIHETWINEFQLSILEALQITKHKLELCIQKEFYSPLLFKNLLGPSEENIITLANSSGSL